MEIFLDVSQAKAIGDTIASTPTLRKLYQTYEKKVFVISEHLEIFENNPYVQKCYKPNAVNIDFIKEKTLYHNSFWGIGQKNERGVEYKHNNMDIRQFHAVTLGNVLIKANKLASVKSGVVQAVGLAVVIGACP